MDPNQNAAPAQLPFSEENGWRRNIAVGWVSLILGVLVTVCLIPTQIGPVGSGATILAMIGAGGLIVFGAILAAGTFQAPPTEADPPVGERIQRQADNWGRGEKQATGVILVAITYPWLLEWGGFLPASYASLAALLLLLGVRSMRVILLLPAIVVSVVYLGIDLVLGAHMPEGRIEWGGLFAAVTAGGE